MYETMVMQNCDALIDAINTKRKELLEVIAHDKEMRIKLLKEQVGAGASVLIPSTAHMAMSHTSGLLVLVPITSTIRTVRFSLAELYVPLLPTHHSTRMVVTRCIMKLFHSQIYVQTE